MCRLLFASKLFHFISRDVLNCRIHSPNHICGEIFLLGSANAVNELLQLGTCFILGGLGIRKTDLLAMIGLE